MPPTGLVSLVSSDRPQYSGAVFTLQPERLLQRVRTLDGMKLRGMIEKFERTWYRAARPGMPEGDALDTFRRAKAEAGQPDLERFVKDWTELRIVLELAAVNQLVPALIFYGSA